MWDSDLHACTAEAPAEPPALVSPPSQRGGLPGLAHLAAGVLLSEDEGAMELPLQGRVDSDLHRSILELHKQGFLRDGSESLCSFPSQAAPGRRHLLKGSNLLLSETSATGSLSGRS